MDLASVLYGPYTPDQSMEVTMCMTITMTMVTATAIIIMMLVAGWICECCRSTNDDNVKHLHGLIMFSVIVSVTAMAMSMFTVAVMLVSLSCTSLCRHHR